MTVGYAYNSEVSTEISPGVIVPPLTLISGLIGGEADLILDIAQFNYSYQFANDDDAENFD